MASNATAIRLLAKGYAGEALEVEPKESEKNLSPSALLQQGYAKAEREEKAKAAISIEITKTKPDDQ